MEWRDEGVLLTARPHGEASAIVEVFTVAHGRHAGVVRGGSGRRMAPVLQPGAQLALTWRARLEDHIGSFAVEPLRSRAGGIMHDRLALAGLNAICAILAHGLAERAPYPALYHRTQTLLDLLEATPAWPLAYLQWEVALLEDLGFGLDLERCAVTGASTGLEFVSPRSGRAVTRAGAGDWAGRLLPLPPCLLGEGEGSNAEIAQALRTTGYFLEHNLPLRFAGQVFPPARGRLVDMLARYSEAGTNNI